MPSKLIDVVSSPDYTYLQRYDIVYLLLAFSTAVGPKVSRKSTKSILPSRFSLPGFLPALMPMGRFSSRLNSSSHAWLKAEGRTYTKYASSIPEGFVVYTAKTCRLTCHWDLQSYIVGTQSTDEELEGYRGRNLKLYKAVALIVPTDLRPLTNTTSRPYYTRPQPVP